jgi:hypothetical protein
MIADQFRTIVAIADAEQVTESEKSSQEECDDDRKKFSQT